VEQSAAASEAMQDQARKLAELVSVFRVERVSAPVSTALTVRATPKATPRAMPKLPTPVPRKAAVKESTTDWEEF
jgi:methyl-accepting chemotaxis protein